MKILKPGVRVLPLLFTCSMTLEKDPTLSGPLSFPVCKSNVAPLARSVSPLLWSLGNSNICLILFYVGTTILGSLLPAQPRTLRSVPPRLRDLYRCWGA